MTTDREVLNERLRAKVNQRVYTTFQISDLLRNIGIISSDVSIRNNLRGNEVLPSNFGIDSRISGYNRKVRFYGEEAIWEYLKRLESKGKVDLTSLGIDNFDDLLSRMSTLKDRYIKGRIIRKPILDD